MLIGGDDLIIVNLDSRPEDDRFALHADINAPAGGLVGKIAGLKQDATLKIVGRGSWTKWAGSLSAAVDKKPLAQLAMEAANGQYHLSDTLQQTLLVGGMVDRLSDPRSEKRPEGKERRSWCRSGW